MPAHNNNFFLIYRVFVSIVIFTLFSSFKLFSYFLQPKNRVLVLTPTRTISPLLKWILIATRARNALLNTKSTMTAIVLRCVSLEHVASASRIYISVSLSVYTYRSPKFTALKFVGPLRLLLSERFILTINVYRLRSLPKSATFKFLQQCLQKWHKFGDCSQDAPNEVNTANTRVENEDVYMQFLQGKEVSPFIPFHSFPNKVIIYTVEVL